MNITEKELFRWLSVHITTNATHNNGNYGYIRINKLMRLLEMNDDMDGNDLGIEINGLIIFQVGYWASSYYGPDLKSEKDEQVWIKVLEQLDEYRNNFLQGKTEKQLAKLKASDIAMDEFIAHGAKEIKFEPKGPNKIPIQPWEPIAWIVILVIGIIVIKLMVG